MKKILLVDNVRSILEQQKCLLNRRDFQIYTAITGEEALDIHKKEGVDIIIMDLHMPGMSGEAVCRAIRQDASLKKVSILMATLSDDPEEVERCMNAGANGHIKKPIMKDDLEAKTAKLLEIPTRQAIRILMRVKLDAKLGGEFFIANTVDVSATGLLFECERDLKEGDVIEISFFLPGVGGFNRVVMLSEIMRAAPGKVPPAKRYGVKFNEFREGTREVIAKFVTEKTSKT
jgi:CheY-like chemotaxis protein